MALQKEAEFSINIFGLLERTIYSLWFENFAQILVAQNYLGRDTYFFVWLKMT